MLQCSYLWPLSLLLLLLAVCLTAYAQPLDLRRHLDGVELRQHIDTLRLTTAQTLQLTLTVIAPADVIVEFEAVAETLGPFKVTKRTPKGPIELEPGYHGWQRSYSLQAEQSGRQLLPMLSISFFRTAVNVSRTPCVAMDTCDRRARNGFAGYKKISKVQLIHSDAVSIQVNPAPAVKQKSKPEVQQTVLAEVKNKPSLTIMIAVVFIGLIAIFWWLQGRRKPVTGQSLTMPAGQKQSSALQELQQLQKDFANHQAWEVLYQRLDDLLRRHLAARFQITTHSATTDELLTSLEDCSTGNELLSRILRRADQVKFALHKPKVKDCTTQLADVELFIQQSS